MDEDGDPEFMAIVFPPSKHENLHLLPLPAASLSPQSSSSTSNFSAPSSYSSPSSSSSESFQMRMWRKATTRALPSVLRSRHPDREAPVLDGCVSRSGRFVRRCLGKFASLEGAARAKGARFCSMGALAVVVAWVWWLYKSIRFRRRWTTLVRGIRERDERIGQLLHQIAQMNEVLLRKHKELASRLAN